MLCSSLPRSRRHPFGVEPMGNFLLVTDTSNILPRGSGLGLLSYLSDAGVIDVLKGLGPRDLCQLCLCSKILYIFCHEEDLWKDLVIDYCQGQFIFQRTYYETLKYHWKKSIQNVGSTSYSSLSTQGSRPSYPCIQLKGFFSDILWQPWQCATTEMKDSWIETESIPRHSNLSLEDFIKYYETPNKPVIITDVVPQWLAFTQNRWSKENLLHKYGKTSFLCGGELMTLENYFHYSDQVIDCAPLYLFDRSFGEREGNSKEILNDYTVPKYFEEDLFNLLHGKKERPPFRWFLIGPKGSGSAFHKDPNTTSAWNGLLVGRKKWIMYPPHVIPPGTIPSEDQETVTVPLSLMEWFANFYRFKNSKEVSPAECVLQPGELLFIPNGWWHCAINLEESIAITQNFVSPRNLKNILRFLAHSKVRTTQKLSTIFRSCLETSPQYSSFYHQTLSELNEEEARLLKQKNREQKILEKQNQRKLDLSKKRKLETDNLNEEESESHSYKKPTVWEQLMTPIPSSSSSSTATDKGEFRLSSLWEA